jgi:hypothetical protein
MSASHRASASTRRRLLVVLLVLPCAACGTGRAEPVLRDGDLVFQISRSAQSLAIQRATGSPYSHMGMLVHRDGQPFVFEAAVTARYTPLASWVARGQDQRYVVKRLRDAEERITPEVLRKAQSVMRELAGKPYDFSFEWSDSRMYCSELVWKTYDRALGIQLGDLQKLREFELDDPVVRVKLRERYGERIPLDEPVISPAAMFASPLLETVAER